MQFVWCYIKHSSLGNEIQLSMASVRKFFQGDAEFVIVGDRPDGYDGLHISTDPIVNVEFSRYRDVISKMQKVSSHDLIDDIFIWMMDDVYFIRSIDISDLIVQRREADWKRSELNQWHRLKTKTMDYLLERGFPTIDYATHMPHLIGKEHLRQMFDEHPVYEKVLLWENLYENLNQTVTWPYGSFFARAVHPMTLSEIDRLFQNCCIVNHNDKAWNAAMKQWLSERIGVSFDSPKSRNPNLRVVKREMRGLGDLVETGLASVGITKHRVRRIKQKVTGNMSADCNCERTQEWLNQFLPFD